MAELIKIKKLREDAIIPTQGSMGAAGWDLYACLDTEKVMIEPFSTMLIHTGIATNLPNKTYAAIHPRSGIATKRGLNLANCVAVIDADYTGEWMIPIHNMTPVQQTIENHERIAQFILHEVIPLTFEEVEELDTTERGAGGFGSSGKK